jgi:hypothetical protein
MTITTAAQPTPAVPMLDRTRPQPGCNGTNTRRYMTGWRCKQHSPAAMAGRPEPDVDPTRTLQALQAKTGKPLAERVCTTTNHSAAGTQVSLLVWPPDPELQRMAELVDSIMGTAAAICSDCGEPFNQPGLIKRCRDRHEAAQR